MRRGWEHGGKKRRVPREQARELRSERFLVYKKGCAQERTKPRAAPKNEKKNGMGEEGKEGSTGGTLGKGPMGEEGAEGAREQRTWCMSTSEGARFEQVRKLVRDVSAFVDGKALAGTKV